MQFAAAMQRGTVLLHFIALYIHQECCAAFDMRIDECSCFFFIINMMVI
jgi:hypothetical protein